MRSKYKIILTQKVIIVFFVTLILGFVFYNLGFSYNLSPIDTIYYILIVFPLGVILGHSEKRRFKVIELIANIKAQIIALAYAYKDRDPILENNINYQNDLFGYILKLNEYLGMDNKKSEFHKGIIINMENILGTLSHNNEIMRKNGVTASEVSRANQYINHILVNFETLKGYKYYNTSKLILLFLEVVLLVGGIILIPHFLSNGFYGIFVSPVITTTFLILINIERILDNPLIRHKIVDTIDLDYGLMFEKRLEHIFSEQKIMK